MERGIDAEARDDVLGAVVGADEPRVRGAGEWARGAGWVEGGVEGEVDGEGLGEAVGVIVGDVADLD